MSDTTNTTTQAQAAEQPEGESRPIATADNGEGSVKASAELIRAALGQVYDPEIGIDIVSLGLIYDVELDDAGLLRIDMTLTSPYCPLGGVIQSQAHAVCSPLPGVKDVRVDLVWSPPWDPRVMASDEAKLELGIY
jgi:metal-sulfur cluster biosynthetic enzyme